MTAEFENSNERRVGPYALQREIGRSELAVVYLAHDSAHDRRVAITILHPSVAAAIDTSRFIQEIGRAAALDHPHIISMLGAGVADDSVYYAMAFVEGESLAVRLERQPELSATDALRFTTEVANALAYAESKGLHHLGLEPSNILLSEGRALLADFGFASAMVAAGGETQLVSRAYRSRDASIAGHNASRADVYSLGCVLYAMLAGRAPLLAGPPRVALARRAAERRTGVDWGVLARVIGRAIEASPGARYPDVQAFESALRQSPSLETSITGEFDSPLAGELNEPIIPARMTNRPRVVNPVDENVQFTVYRPRVIRPNEWYPMLAFAHLGAPRAGESREDPLARVEQEAKKILGSRIADFPKLVQDSSQPVFRSGTITFVPAVNGLEFNPPQRSFRWVESVHREEFRVRAAPELDGTTARGRLTVYSGAIILADIPLTIRVDNVGPASLDHIDAEPANATPYRRIFASYSHSDVEIVRQFERFAATLGDRYLRDANDLRAGEVWDERLAELIRDADILQLFWSSNAMQSPFVRQEWEYALSLERPNFVRPTYWEDPLPRSPDGTLPPESLQRLHFQRIAIAPRSPHVFLETITATTRPRIETVERETSAPGAPRAVTGPPAVASQVPEIPRAATAPPTGDSEFTAVAAPSRPPSVKAESASEAPPPKTRTPPWWLVIGILVPVLAGLFTVWNLLP